MINSQSENPVFLKEALIDRCPRHFRSLLEGLWEKHYGDIFEFENVKSSGLEPSKTFQSYGYKSMEVMLILEHLFRNGLISSGKFLFDKTGRLREDISLEEILKLVDQKLLSGISVCCIGGPEGRIFAEMGASAVNIDPLIKKSPRLTLPNLEEVSKFLDEETANRLKNRFDLTWSSWLFDRGSGLDSKTRWDFSTISSDEIGSYQNFLKLILTMTKSGGISIHNGNMMPKTVKNITGIGKVVEIAPSFLSDKPGYSSIVYVLKKL